MAHGGPGVRGTQACDSHSRNSGGCSNLRAYLCYQAQKPEAGLVVANGTMCCPAKHMEERPQNSHFDFHPAPSTPRGTVSLGSPPQGSALRPAPAFSWSLRDRQVHSLLSSEHQISPDCLRNLVTPPGMLSGRGSPSPCPAPTMRPHPRFCSHPIARLHGLPTALKLAGQVWGPWDPWVCVRQQQRRLTGPAPSALGCLGAQLMPSRCLYAEAHRMGFPPDSKSKNEFNTKV